MNRSQNPQGYGNENTQNIRSPHESQGVGKPLQNSGQHRFAVDHGVSHIAVKGKIFQPYKILDINRFVQPQIMLDPFPFSPGSPGVYENIRGIPRNRVENAKGYDRNGHQQGNRQQKPF